MTEANVILIKIMMPWIIACCMLSYGAILGACLAFKDKKTDLQKLFLLCGTGIMVLMMVVSK